MELVKLQAAQPCSCGTRGRRGGVDSRCSGCIRLARFLFSVPFELHDSSSFLKESICFSYSKFNLKFTVF